MAASPVNIARMCEIEKQFKAAGRDTVWIATTDCNDNTIAGVPAGRVTEIDARGAAFALLRGTHREATDQEIAACKAEAKAREENLKEREQASKQQYALPPDLADLVKTLATQQAKNQKEK